MFITFQTAETCGLNNNGNNNVNFSLCCLLICVLPTITMSFFSYF